MQEKWQNNLQKFFVGFGTGILACILNIPFDVAKSRIQGPQSDYRKPKYRGTFSSIATVYREEGLVFLNTVLLSSIIHELHLHRYCFALQNKVNFTIIFFILTVLSWVTIHLIEDFLTCSIGTTYYKEDITKITC